MKNETPEMKPGDILLYNGTSIISWAIKKLDAAEVSHAGIYLGDNMVAEALNPGVVEQPRQESFQGCYWVRYSRHDYADKDPLQLKPVLDYANRIVAEKHRYAYAQIVLLAFICISRRIDYTDKPMMRAIAHVAIVLAHKAIEEFYEDRRAEPMICSQFVYQCYEDALPNERTNPYNIVLSRAPDVPAIGEILVETAAELLESATVAATNLDDPSATPEKLERLLQRYRTELEDGRPPLLEDAGDVPSMELLRAEAAMLFQDRNRMLARPPKSGMVTQPGVYPEFVTPGDLDRALNIKQVAQIDTTQPPRPEPKKTGCGLCRFLAKMIGKK